MTNNSPSSGLEAIMRIMESEEEVSGRIHIFDTIHFSSTRLHGLHKGPVDISKKIGLKDKGTSFTFGSPLITTKKLMARLSPNAQLGIALGQAIAGMPVNIFHTMPKDMEDMITAYKPKTIYCFGPHRNNFDLQRMKGSDIIQIEMVDIEGKMPIYLPEIRIGKDVMKVAELLDEIAGIPLIFEIPSSDIKKDLDFLLISNIDSILIDCSSDPYEKRPDINMLTSMIHANRQIELFKNREKGLKIIMNGPVRNTADIMKLMSLGADFIGIDHLTLLFLRSYLSFKTGDKFVTDDDLNESNDALDWAEIGELYSEFISVIHERMKNASSQYRSAERIRYEGYRNE